MVRFRFLGKIPNLIILAYFSDLCIFGNLPMTFVIQPVVEYCSCLTNVVDTVSK